VHGPNGFFPSDDNLLQALAQAFARIGVETQVEALPPATLFTRATNREFSLFMTYFSSAFAINGIRQVVMTRDPQLGHGPFNRQRYSNPAVDEPAKEALATMDRSGARRWCTKPARALLEDKGVVPVIFLRNTWAGRRDRVAYQPDVYNRTSALNARPVD
jgi:peptide/nickel transport system substrate-binding protein